MTLALDWTAKGGSHRELLRYLSKTKEVELGRKRRAVIFPETETASSLGDAMLPAKVRRSIRVMIVGGFVDRADKVLGRGKTHFLAALAGNRSCGIPSGFCSVRRSNWWFSC